VSDIVIDGIPEKAQPALMEMSDTQKASFLTEYNRRKRSTGLMLLLAILFPIQLFFLGRIGLGILFLLTAGGFGVWYVIEWFLTPGRVRKYNQSLALQIVQDLQTMG